MTDLTLGSLVIERDGAPGAVPPVVMVHGLGGSSTSFEPLLDACGERLVLRPDLPGSGRSAARAGARDIAGLAAALDEVLRVAGVKRAHLVGHSLGTLVVRELARRRPARVASLVLFGALTVPSDTARRALGERAELARRDGLAGIASAVAGGSVAPGSHAAARAFVRDSVLRQNPRDYASLCELLAAALPIDGHAFAGPVTLVTGELDAVAPPAMAQALAGGLADARFRRLPDVGHWPMIEAPEASLAALRAHLARADAAAAGELP